MAAMLGRSGKQSIAYLSKLSINFDSQSCFPRIVANYNFYRKDNRLFCSEKSFQNESDNLPNHKVTETENSDDFFGFHSEEGVINIPVNENPSETPVQKFESLFHKPTAERLYETNYGKIRFDFQNSPEYHGQFDGENLPNTDFEMFTSVKSHLKFKATKESKESISKSIEREVDETEGSNIDEQCFENLLNNKEYYHSSILTGKDEFRDETKDMQSDERKNIEEEKNVKFPATSQDYTIKINEINDCKSALNAKPSYLDEIFFEDILKKDEIPTNKTKYDGSISNSFIENQFFPEIEPNVKKYSVGKNDVDLTESKQSNIIKKEIVQKISRVTSEQEFNSLTDGKSEIVSTLTKQSPNLSFNTERQIRQTDKIYKVDNGKQKANHFTPNVKEPKTAFDYIAKIRKEKNLENSEVNKAGQTKQYEDKIFSEGRVKPLVIDLEKQPEYFVMKLLKESILYNKDGIIGINKPYGLTCQYSRAHRHCLQNFLSKLAPVVDKENDSPQLYTVHRLDANTTGVLILAKNQEMAHQLNLLFQERTIQKTYLAIVKGIPDPKEGIINIPIAESKVDGKTRMILKPDYDSETDAKLSKGTFDTYKAITFYRVISTANGASLLEIKPQTGFTHQIRVHLGFGLNCPIIGDHKYSHLSRFAPQKLTPPILQKLKVRQSKVRDLPLHLHSYSIVIPEITDGRNVHIQAKLPRHFLWTLKKLQLNKN